MTHSQQYALDRRVNFSWTKMVDIVWYLLYVTLASFRSLWQVSVSDHQSKSKCIMAHSRHYALDHPASQNMKSVIYRLKETNIL